MIRNSIFIVGASFKASPVCGALVALFSIAFACVPAAQVLLMASLIEELGTDNATYQTIAPQIASIIVLVGLVSSLRTVRDFIAEIVQLETGATLQGQLADRTAKLEPHEIATEDLASEIEGHSRAIVDHISRVYGDALMAVESILGAIGVVIALANYSLAAAGLTVLTIIPAVTIGVYISRAHKRMWLLLGKIYRRERYLRETLGSRSALLELTSFGTVDRIGELEKEAQARICEVRKGPIRAGLQATGIAAAVNGTLFALAIGAVFLGVGFTPVATAAVYGVFGAVNAVATGGSKIALLVQYGPTVASLVVFLSRPVPPQVSRFASEEAGPIETLEVRDLTLFYPESSRPAVREASLSLSRGEMIAIVGRNGAGKTTLLNGLLGMLPIAGGRVLVNGRPVAPAAQDWWLSNFGAMAQDFGKYELTVSQSVALGRSGGATDSEVMDALRSARAEDFVDGLGQGVSTQLGEVWGGVGLSGGQWQRLALARVYLRNADIWVLDEPSSAIDAETEVEIFDELRRSRKERATIVVSHRAWTLREMERIYVMEAGQIVEAGSFEELLSREGYFARLFREQTLERERPSAPVVDMQSSTES